MEMYLISSGGTFRFPLPPLEEIGRDYNKRFETIDIIDVGEIDRGNGRKIGVTTVKALIPPEVDPPTLIKQIEEWADEEQPLRLIITQYNFNKKVIISNFNATQNASFPDGDQMINFTFRDWRPEG